MASATRAILRYVTAAVGWYTRATEGLSAMAARMLGGGAFCVRRILDGGTCDWARPATWASFAPGDLMQVRYVRDERFYMLLTRAYDPVRACLLPAPATTVLLAILNGINVTRGLTPVLASMTDDNRLTVGDLVRYLAATGGLTRQDLVTLALHEGPLEIILFDRDLGEHVFKGGDTVVALQ